MARSQSRPKRKLTGGKYKSFRKKKKYELGRDPVKTKLGERSVKSIWVMSRNKKVKMLSENNVNVDGKKIKIINVIGNPANPHFVRRNIITKGSILLTEIGEVKVTSRPGQQGSLCGVVVKKK